MDYRSFEECLFDGKDVRERLIQFIRKNPPESFKKFAQLMGICDKTLLKLLHENSGISKIVLIKINKYLDEHE